MHALRAELRVCQTADSAPVQAPVRTSDLLNVMACMAGGPLAEGRAAAFPCLAAPPGGKQPGALAGAAYYEAKQQLVHNEQLVLRSIHFNISVEQPHRWLLNFCRGLRCPAQLTQLALCLLNDAVCVTTLDLQLSAPCLAGTCLYLAATLLPQGHSLSPGWPQTLGLEVAELEAAGQQLLAALCGRK